MGIFNFKRFSVVNDRSAMKVNTDGVLLGAAMTIRPSDRRLLDVGTGTGTIALMAAQRMSDMDVSDAAIEAVEIDEASAHEAAANFEASPWKNMLFIRHVPFDEFADHAADRYDLIFSNPPYFDLSLLAPSERRCNARHTSAGLSFREILEFASERLSEKGRISMVLPADQEAHLCRYARMCGLHLFNIVRVRTVPRKQPCRIIAEFSRERCASVCEMTLTIQNEGKYTEEYLSLTHDFYLFA
ncbi:MAG: tRNA1(Val) (adenine(37)-N6)-methyltransferase [Candidatus Cryptobacteroides sp.]